MNLKKSIVSFLVLGALALPMKSNGQALSKKANLSEGINFYSSWVDKNGNRFIDGENELLNFGKNDFLPGEKITFYISNSNVKKAQVSLVLKNFNTGLEENLGSTTYRNFMFNTYSFNLSRGAQEGNYEIQSFFEDGTMYKKEFRVGKSFEEETNSPQNYSTKLIMYNYWDDKGKIGVLDNIEELVGFGKSNFNVGEKISFAIISDEPIIKNNPYKIIIKDVNSQKNIFEGIETGIGSSFRYIEFERIPVGNYKITFDFYDIGKKSEAFFKIHKNSQ